MLQAHKSYVWVLVPWTSLELAAEHKSALREIAVQSVNAFALIREWPRHLPLGIGHSIGIHVRRNMVELKIENILHEVKGSQITTHARTEIWRNAEISLGDLQALADDSYQVQRYLYLKTALIHMGIPTSPEALAVSQANQYQSLILETPVLDFFTKELGIQLGIHPNTITMLRRGLTYVSEWTVRDIYIESKEDLIRTIPKLGLRSYGALQTMLLHVGLPKG
jgi:hypothetical protein